MEAVFVGTPRGQTVSYTHASGRKCSIFKAETSALQTTVAYIAEMKPQKTVILTDSKADLLSLISNTSNQPIYQLLKACSFSLKNALWSYSGSRPTVGFHCMKKQIAWPSLKANKADRLAKSGSKQLQPLSTSTYQEAKTLLRNSQGCQWRRATGDYNLSTHPINRLVRHEQTIMFRLGTEHCSLSTETPVTTQDESTTHKLWGTAEGLHRTTQFLAKCRSRV